MFQNIWRLFQRYLQGFRCVIYFNYYIENNRFDTDSPFERDIFILWVEALCILVTEDARANCEFFL